MWLVKVPVPVPSTVCKPAISGVEDRLQQVPRAVISALPSKVIVPPQVAVVVRMLVTTAVVNAGISGPGSGGPVVVLEHPVRNSNTRPATTREDNDLAGVGIMDLCVLYVESAEYIFNNISII
jgi:hypothetical protein